MTSVPCSRKKGSKCATDSQASLSFLTQNHGRIYTPFHKHDFVFGQILTEEFVLSASIVQHGSG